MPTNVKMKLTMTRSSVGFLKALREAHMIFKRRRKCGHQRASLKTRSCTGDGKQTDGMRRNAGSKDKDRVEETRGSDLT